MHYPLPWFPLSDDPSRCNCRTIRGCRPYRSSHAGYQFGRSGSSGFVGSFRRLRLSNRGLAPAARRNLGRRRDRYICRPSGFPARGGCRFKQSGFALRDEGCLKNVFSDNLTVLLEFNPIYNKLNSVQPTLTYCYSYIREAFKMSASILQFKVLSLYSFIPMFL